MQWQKALYDHEESPPPEVWTSLKETLSEENGQVRQQLLAHEAEPPPGIWENIAASLKEEARPEKTTPVRTLPARPFLRVASVAAGLALISILTYLYVNLRETPDIGKLSAGLTRKKGNTAEGIQTAPASQQFADTTKSSAPENYSSAQKEPLKIAGSAPVKDLVQLPATEGAKQETAWQNTRKESRRINARMFRRIRYTDRKYILVGDGKGTWNRVSYKLSGMVKSMHEISPATDRPDEDAVRWSEKLADWQDRISRSAFLPSPGNFLDIAEMSELLRDK
jgi:hypothetical protein